MSRRPNAPADKAAQNQQTLKSLVKLESNKTCADCKRNKHPRWASWNLGVFVCIRCSGIHRGMGTHISRVKSVDLDAWTDEQLQSVIIWGNARANKYWESKLASGHVPSEAKMENFIRTKYESKRWVMDGPIPDPSTLDGDGDDDVPLNVVQGKAKLDRSSSQRASSISSQPALAGPKTVPSKDLFGDDSPLAPPRPNTTEPASARSAPPKAEKAPPKQSRPGESLLGLDFLGGFQSSSPSRPTSNSDSTLSSDPARPNLKQSILSLYSSAPKASPQPAAQPQPPKQASHSRAESFGLPQSPEPFTHQQSASNDLTDAFSGLNFSAQPSKPMSSFSGMPSTSNSTGANSAGFGSGGSFFDPPASKPLAKTGSVSSPGGFGDFLSSTSNSDFSAPKPAGAPPSGDLFDLSGGPPVAPSQAAPAPRDTSAFNLSSSAAKLSSAVLQSAPKQSMPLSSGLSNVDAWGTADAWSTPSDPAPPQTTIATAGRTQPNATSSSNTSAFAAFDDSGWGNPSSDVRAGNSNSNSNSMGGSGFGFGSEKPAAPPTIMKDEDFGGWTSSDPVAEPAKPAAAPKPAPKPMGGGFSGDDLFSNVWE